MRTIVGAVSGKIPKTYPDYGAGAHDLHEEAAEHPGRDLTEQDPLAAAVASGLLEAAERAWRSLEGAKGVARPLDLT